MATQAAAPSIDEPPLKREGPSSGTTTVVDPDTSSPALDRALRVASGDVHHPSAETISCAIPPDVRTCVFEQDDPLNPLNWPTSKKIWITAQALLYAVMTGLNLGWYSSSTAELRAAMSGSPSGIELQLGNALWVWAVALTPLVLAPFSEVYGRRWFYPISITIYGLASLCQVYPRNLAALLVGRFICGAAGAVGNTLVAGSIADIWPAKTRGWLMAAFAFAIFACTGTSLYIGTVIIINLGAQWIGWITLILSLALAAMYTFFLPETRSNVLLYKKKRRIEKETGHTYYAIGEEERMASWRKLVTRSLTRPVYFLIHEPIVFCFSAWLAFLWGVMFLLLQSVPLVFALYGFTQAERGLAFASLLVGASVSFIGHFHQEHLYRRDAARARAAGLKPRPESRLYHAMVGAGLFPIGAIILAWTGRPHIHWLAPCIGLAIIGAAILPAYLAIFLYLADVYEIWSSSALACQSLCRNISVGAMTLFAAPLYEHFPRPAGTGIDYSYALAGTMLAGVGLLLGVVPFILFRYGERVCKSSKIASAIWAAEPEENQALTSDGSAEQVARAAEEKGPPKASDV